MNKNIQISENSNFKIIMNKEFENFLNYSNTLKALINANAYLKLTFNF